MCVDVVVIVGDPRLPRRHITAVRPPVTPVITDHGKQRILNLVQTQNARVRHCRAQRSHVKGEDLRKPSHQKLLRAPLLATLLACPIRNRMRLGGGDDCIHHGLLRLGGDDRKLNHRVSLAVCIGTVVTLEAILHAKSEELVQHRDLVTQKLQQFVRITNALSSRHQRRIHTCIQILKTHCTQGRPNGVEAHFNWIVCVVLFILEALLQVRDAKDSLERSIDPARSSLVAQAK